MTCVKTFSTNFEPMCQRLRLAHETGGFTIHQGELVRIVCLEELSGVAHFAVDLVPASFPDVVVPPYASYV